MKVIIDVDVNDDLFALTNAIRNGIPLSKIINQIQEEKEYAYADFEQYKVDYLGIDPEYVCDELPNDDFRYGMERCIEIIDRVISELN